jgi:hypothetical protein
VEFLHVVTPHSIGVLSNITGYPIFGKHVTFVGICSARPTARMEGQRLMALNGYITTRSFARDLEQVFVNIKQHLGSVTITIYDNPGIGNLEAWSGSRLAAHPRLTPIKCHGWQDLLKFSPSYITYRTAETFEQTVYFTPTSNSDQMPWRREHRHDDFSSLTHFLTNNRPLCPSPLFHQIRIIPGDMFT